MQHLGRQPHCVITPKRTTYALSASHTRGVARHRVVRDIKRTLRTLAVDHLVRNPLQSGACSMTSVVMNPEAVELPRAAFMSAVALSATPSWEA